MAIFQNSDISMIYLDNQTCAQPCKEIKKKLEEFLENEWGVPGVPHAIGQRMLGKMEEAYRSIYRLLNLTEEDNFIFTSSGAEAINHIIFSTYMDFTRESGKNHFLTSSGDEAPSILAMERLAPLGCMTDMVPLDSAGKVSPKALSESITPRTALFSISYANAMTGVIHPVEELSSICRERGVRFHLDVTSVLGKLYLDWDEIQPDFVTFNGEQLHALPGTGGLCLLKENHLSPFIIGGYDQNGQRAGTVNVPGLYSLGIAADEMDKHQDYMSTEIVRLRDLFEEELLKAVPFARVLFCDSERVSNISVIAFPGISSDLLLYSLAQVEVYASFGGGNFQQMALLLQASDIDSHLAQCALHFSLSRFSCEKEIKKAVQLIAEQAKKIQKTSEYLED
jgi:cysteine desulfurase